MPCVWRGTRCRNVMPKSCRCSLIKQDIAQIHELRIQSVIKHKIGLLNLAAELGNISKACRIMGFSRDTFYLYEAARDGGGVEALFDVSRRKPKPG